MKSLLFLMLFLTLPNVSFSQTENDRIVLIDSLENETNDEFHYLRKIKNYYSKVPSYEYVVEDYYKSGKIEMIGKSLSKQYLLRNGDFIHYYENGNKKKMMKYDRSNPIGKIYMWHENGNKKVAGEYFSDPKKPEIYELKIYQYWDENNVQKVTDGNGFYDETNSAFRTSSSGEIKNGSKHGAWSGKSSKYKLNFKELYENGKLISGESVDSLGIKRSYYKVQEVPEPISGMAYLTKYIAKNYRFPHDLVVHADVTIVLSFSIGIDGSIQDLKTIQSVRKDLDEEAIRIVKSYGKWKPGFFRGFPAKAFFRFPIKLARNE